MRVLVAGDGIGALGPVATTAVLAQGWLAARPRDDVLGLPVCAGGQGLVEVLEAAGAEVRSCEVADASGLPREARWCVTPDATAWVEAAQATAHAADGAAGPTAVTSWGVGQLVAEARRSGATHVRVGAGGGRVADAGAGALTALGLRLRVGDGQGLRVGAGNVAGLVRIEPGWADDWAGVRVDVLADTGASLLDAASRLTPREGEDPDVPTALAAALRRFAAVAATDLPLPGLGRGAHHVEELVDARGGGAGGGLAFGLAAALGGQLLDAAPAVADALDVAGYVRDADVVVGLVRPVSAGVVPTGRPAAVELLGLAAEERERSPCVWARAAGARSALDALADVSLDTGDVLESALHAAATRVARALAS